MADSFEKIVRAMTREVYENMRRAVELGRWPDGRAVSPEQRETSLQAIIAWETIHLPEEQRTGYMPTNDCSSKADEERPVSLRDAAERKDA